MARPSSIRPRDSIYPSAVLPREPTFVCSPHLQACVTALEDCITVTHTAHERLYNGVSDFQRVSQVLESERMSVMVNAATVDAFKTHIMHEVGPQIRELVDRADKGVKALQRRENTARAKVDAAQARAAAQPAPHKSAASKLEEKRLAQIKKQRAMLEREMLALEAEVQALDEQLLRKS